MSTLNELIAHRDTAGARYVAAVAEFRAAFADLGAIERLLESKISTIATFGGPVPDMIPMRHPKYLPNNGGMLFDDTKAAFAVRAAAFGTLD
jgi:hypothetical protein